MSFEATITRASTLKKIIAAVSELITDAKFELTPNAFTLQAMDSANTSLISLLLQKSGFEKYHCDRTMNLGINLESLTKVLKCAGNDDKVTLKTTEKGDVITIIFESNYKVCDFELKLMEIDIDQLRIPDIEYNSVVKMPALEFQKIVSNLSTWGGDTVMISTNKKGVKFSVTGDLGSGNIQLKANADIDAESGVVLEVKENVSLTFAIKKLVTFTKATPLSTAVKLAMSDEVPLLVEYEIDDLGYIRYYLAPKIEENAQ